MVYKTEEEVRKKVVYSLESLVIHIKRENSTTRFGFIPSIFDGKRQMTCKERTLKWMSECDEDGRRPRGGDGEYYEVESVIFETSDRDCTPDLPPMLWKEYVSRGRPGELTVEINCGYAILK